MRERHHKAAFVLGRVVAQQRLISLLSLLDALLRDATKILNFSEVLPERAPHKV